MSRNKHTKTRKITLFGEKMAQECQRSQKIHSYVKFETNSAAKRKAIWSQKVDLYLQTLAKWSLEKLQVSGVSLLQAIELYTKTPQKNRILSEEGNKFEWKRRKFRLG